MAARDTRTGRKRRIRAAKEPCSTRHTQGQSRGGKRVTQWQRETRDLAWFRDLGLHKKLFAKAIDVCQGKAKDTLNQLATRTATDDAPGDETDPDWSLVPFRRHLNGFVAPGADNREEQSRRNDDILGGVLLGLGASEAVNLINQLWSRVEDRTPSETVSDVRPNEDTIRERISAPEATQVLQSLQQIGEGDPSVLAELLDSESDTRT